jgi:hypothetical protein
MVRKKKDKLIEAATKYLTGKKEMADFSEKELDEFQKVLDALRFKVEQTIILKKGKLREAATQYLTGKKEMSDFSEKELDEFQKELGAHNCVRKNCTHYNEEYPSNCMITLGDPISDSMLKNPRKEGKCEQYEKF